MAAIISQMAANRRNRQKMFGCQLVPSDKCVHTIPPFDRTFDPTIHNKYVRASILASNYAAGISNMSHTAAGTESANFGTGTGDTIYGQVCSKPITAIGSGKGGSELPFSADQQPHMLAMAASEKYRQKMNKQMKQKSSVTSAPPPVIFSAVSRPPQQQNRSSSNLPRTEMNTSKIAEALKTVGSNKKTSKNIKCDTEASNDQIIDKKIDRNNNSGVKHTLIVKTKSQAQNKHVVTELSQIDECSDYDDDEQVDSAVMDRKGTNKKDCHEAGRHRDKENKNTDDTFSQKFMRVTQCLMKRPIIVRLVTGLRKCDLGAVCAAFILSLISMLLVLFYIWIAIWKIE